MTTISFFSIFDSDKEDSDLDNMEEQRCSYCWERKAIAEIQIEYDYDYNAHKAKVTPILVCSICHNRLDPQREFAYKEIVKK